VQGRDDRRDERKDRRLRGLGPRGRGLWVRRGDQLKFAGGFYAFPGGRVDVQDSAVPWTVARRSERRRRPAWSRRPASCSRKTGVLAVPGASGVSSQEARPCREALLRRPESGERAASFGEFLARHRLRLDARWFAPAGRWGHAPVDAHRFHAGVSGGTGLPPPQCLLRLDPFAVGQLAGQTRLLAVRQAHQIEARVEAVWASTGRDPPARRREPARVEPEPVPGEKLAERLPRVAGLRPPEAGPRALALRSWLIRR